VTDSGTVHPIQTFYCLFSFRPPKKFLDQLKIISELWHSGTNGRMSITGYLPKKEGIPDDRK